MTAPLLRLATALALVLSAGTAIAQSNSGPTPPDGSAMNPSSDIVACTTTLPMVSSHPR